MEDETKPPKKPVKLKMKVGNIEFEIECQEEQLKGTVEQILATMTEQAKISPVLTEPITREVRAETCKGVIMSLWKESWFSTPKSLQEVHGEMARRGFHYDRTAVAHALVDLVKDNVLTREGRPRRYRYAQKRPPKTG